MAWREIYKRARRNAERFGFADLLTDALGHRREHPGLHALAHSYAATHFRKEAEMWERDGKRRRAWVLHRVARHHRRMRRFYAWRARATAEAQQCECMLEKLEDM